MNRISRRLLVVAVVLWLGPGGRVRAEGAVPGGIAAYWADPAPMLDGRPDDACWQTAEVACDFVLIPSGTPTQRTEVRFAYTARDLYVFWTAFETQMADLLAGSPEAGRDQIDRRESVEIMLHPTRAEKDFLLFAASPRGARFDLSSRTWMAYNPDWQCVAGRFDGGWTIEARIPFGELAESGQVFATPQPGDGWGLQIYRKKANPAETAQWSAAAGWRPLRFGGARSGLARPTVAELSPGPLSYGPGECRLTVHGTTAAVRGTFTVVRDGQPLDRQDLSAASADGVLRFPYRLLEGGNYRLEFELSSGDTVFSAGRAAVTLAPVSELVRAIEPELRAARKAATGDRHAEFARLRRDLDALDQRRRAAADQLRRAAALTAAEWEALRGESTALAAAWARLRFDANLARLYPGRAGQPPVPFALGVATESDKVYPDTAYQGSLTEPVRLALAGNEYGSFQLVVIPFWQDLEVTDVACSALEGPSGSQIPATACRWFRVGYVQLEDPPAWLGTTYAHPVEPDPLLPPARFRVAAGTVAAIWVDLQIPGTTPAGTYRGTVTVTAAGQRVSRTIEVHGYGFDIPTRSSLEVDFWFSPAYGWHSFYLNAEKTRGIIPYTPELHARHAAVLGRYRVGSFPSDWTCICSQVPIYQEPDGRFTFDWTRFDRFVANAVQNGSTAFWCALSCNSGWTAYLNSPDVPVLERATGKRLTIGSIMQSTWDAAGETDAAARFYGKAQYENPVYRDFLVAYVEHLRALGINDSAYYELFDEANQDATPKRWLAMIEHHEFFRRLVPDLHLLNFGLNPTQVVGGKSAVGLIDVWAPHLFQLADPAVHRAVQERRANFGEKCWTYTCTERTDSAGNYTPFCLYHRPYIATRIQPWLAWHLELDGFLIFALNHVPKTNLKPPAERWPAAAWSDGQEMGCGTLVYPGPDFEMIPGMRLANVRDGLEDYEFLAGLRREASALDPRRHARLLARATAALKIEPEIVTSVYIWTRNRSRLEAKREQLAKLIHEVRRAQTPR